MGINEGVERYMQVCVYLCMCVPVHVCVHMWARESRVENELVFLGVNLFWRDKCLSPHGDGWQLIHFVQSPGTNGGWHLQMSVFFSYSIMWVEKNL